MFPLDGNRKPVYTKGKHTWREIYETFVHYAETGFLPVQSPVPVLLLRGYLQSAECPILRGDVN